VAWLTQALGRQHSLRRVLLDVPLLVGVASSLSHAVRLRISLWLQARISLRELVSILSFFQLTLLQTPYVYPVAFLARIHICSWLRPPTPPH